MIYKHDAEPAKMLPRLKHDATITDIRAALEARHKYLLWRTIDADIYCTPHMREHDARAAEVMYILDLISEVKQ